jgi:predicted nucleotidyltransferase
MARLEKAGILVSARAGNLKQFRVNRSCSFFDELKGLILKTAGVAGQIKSLLEAVNGIELAFIYGSFAGGRENAESDVDLLIVGDVDLDMIDASLQGLEKAFGRSVNYVLYDPQEFKEKVTAKDGFISNVLDGEKIALVGDLRGL